MDLLRSTDKAKRRSVTAREAKGLALDLKEVLKKKDPWDREVEFQRQNLRKQYMSLIFESFSDSKPLEVLHLLWLETSHAIIQLYRQKLTAIDEAIAAKHQNGGGKGKHGLPHHHNQVGPVARRRMFQAFRGFLNSEESFWRDQLLVKMVREWGLKEAEPALRSLGVVFAKDDSGPLSGPVLSVSRAPVVPQTNKAMEAGIHNFEVAQVAHDRALNVCQKALICFGDLNRYRELYSEPAKLDKRNNKSNRSMKAQAKRELSYIRAAECYMQARLLLPDNGNPSNQLAVLASYSSDQLSSTYHYYRALCAKESFKTAKGNLEVTYKKVLNRPDNPTLDVAKTFEADFNKFHAMLFLNENLEIVAMRMETLAKEFQACLKGRELSPETVMKVVVIALSAFHINQSLHHTSPASDLDPEYIARDHALLIFKVMFDLAAEEATDGLDIKSPVTGEDVTVQLAQKISASLRRMLPTLRVVSKWMTVNIKYLCRTSSVLAPFWESYVKFLNALREQFPLANVSLDEEAMLEEDVELLGFEPLKGRLRLDIGYERGSNDRLVRKAGGNVETKHMHPNEEHLIRIKDIQTDATFISQKGGGSISESDGKYILAHLSSPSIYSVTTSPREEEHNLRPGLTSMAIIEEGSDHSFEDQSNDDVVDLAMRIGTGRGGSESDDSEDDDEVLYPYKVNLDSTASLPPKDTAPAKTAFDLLSQVLGGGSIPSKDLPLNRPLAHPSIWAPTNQFHQFPDDIYSASAAQKVGPTGWPQFRKNPQGQSPLYPG